MHLQVRAPDANINNTFDLLPGIPFPLTAPYLLREFFHMLQDSIGILDDTLAVDLHGLVRDIAERYVVYGPVFRKVDLLAGEHVIAELLQAALLGQGDQLGQRFLGDEVLAEVEDDFGFVCRVLEGTGEFLEPYPPSVTWRCKWAIDLPARIGLKELLENNVAAQSLMVSFESLPCGQVARLIEAWHCEIQVLEMVET